MTDETTDPIPPSSELAPRDKTPVVFGAAPGTLDEAWRLAQNYARSELVPKSYQGKPANILVAMQLGFEVGLGPMAALQSIAVINGRPGVYGDGLLALVMASPLYAGHGAYFEVDASGAYQSTLTITADDLKRDTTRAVCVFHRRGRVDPFLATFSIADAKRAQLWTKDGPWQTYPGRMLAWRALGFAARAAFPDVLKGLRTIEELEDIPPDDPPPPPTVRRKSDPPDLSPLEVTP